MSRGIELLERDIEVMTTMAGAMQSYLTSDHLFYPISGINMPRLTLGGYLMRQQRVVALFDILSETDQARVQTAMTVYHAALEGNTVRFEQKAQREIPSRLRQWSELIAEIMKSARRDAWDASTNYRGGAEIRVMIEALLTQLRQYPYQLDQRLEMRVAEVDRQLRGRWQLGDFIWSKEWAPAYPSDTYWWLYGQLRV